ncbi:MAG TPA: hypothetical protein VNT30_10105 [Stellaceae bacterium]|nr:hypothetical protein [Stellaceae bacterium]
MQKAFDFGAGAEIAYLRDRLKDKFGHLEVMPTRDPMGQLIKSLISSRTRDQVSHCAYERLVLAYPRWPVMAEAAPNDIQTAIAAVTFADVKVRYLRRTLRLIAANHPDFSLDFLGGWPIAEALAWLERLPGVGRKVSASTLNFSTLQLPAFVIDTHVLRVLRRFGFVRATADTRTAYETVMTAVDAWDAADLAELHVLLKRLGQTRCRAERPCCRGCPISLRCQTGKRWTRQTIGSEAISCGPIEFPGRAGIEIGIKR